ncbi:biliverdin-producing heme oxygenase [Micromonospora sp. CPCC 205561]|uniref:biliverdin-producing heme oxygenase n=1 Tax=Micromonospora sp. CPCC 205561 TaxID=3122407 RepID=UPI002FEE8EE8
MSLTRTAFSAELRAASREAHQGAESQRYVSALIAGELDRAGYAALVAQHHVIYEALEAAAEAMRRDPLAGPFVDDALTRLPALAADLEFLHGPDWRARIEPTPATLSYAGRLRAVCAGSPERFIAHHYTRYLGDLSGGLYIGRSLARHHGLTGDAGAAFYRFDRIGDPRAYKDAYRARLDDLPLDGAGRATLRAEVLVAYRHNTEVLAALSHLVPATDAEVAA